MKLAQRKTIVLPLKQGRLYDCGTMKAVFKADGVETGDRYSVWSGGCRQTPKGQVHILMMRTTNCSLSSRASQASWSERRGTIPRRVRSC